MTLQSPQLGGTAQPALSAAELSTAIDAVAVVDAKHWLTLLLLWRGRFLLAQGDAQQAQHDAKEALRKSTEAATALPPNMEAASAALAASAQSAVPEDSAGSISDSTLGVPNPKAEAASPSKEESGPRLVIESAPKTKAIPPPPPPATRAATPASPNAPPALSSGYSVQVGVFASYANAEDLHAKLSAAGIPNQIESRVSLGPFKTREQALAAQKKLSKMGLGQGMVLPPKK